MDSRQIIPNFFIVGAVKSGTTSLAYYLSQHPDIYLSPVKEPFFFVKDFGLDNEETYLDLFRGAGHARAIGEATTGYLFDDGAAARIASKFPEARIIAILRHPAAVAYSLWKYMRHAGSESLSFEAAISADERRRRLREAFRRNCAGWRANYLYLERGLYSEQVSRYIKEFGYERVSVLIFEEFIQSSQMYCEQIFSFLDVAPDFLVDCRKKLNSGGEARFEWLKKLRNRPYPLLRVLVPYRTRRSLREWTRQINVRPGDGRSIPREVKDTLDGFYREDIRKLEDLIHRKIDVWKYDD